MVEEIGGFKVKKWGVIPPKRRSVKRMMFDQFLNSVSCVFHACCNPVSSKNTRISPGPTIPSSSARCSPKCSITQPAKM
ncbi:hypothetical protein V6N13_143336 [Hibiscus sabdariffa]|uniref:Uncharacterized protein n=1 Tax=Hibiscus sabdariffa TaxID=183260 RepID=A0ABR2FH61_9ROSI